MGLRELALGAGESSRAPLFLTFPSSRIWTVPFDMDVIVHVIGGFASGGAVQGTGNASGAGAPGYAIKRARLSAGTVLNIGIGAPGVSASLAGNGVVNGSDGGTTTVTGGGLNLAAEGGKGGRASSLQIGVLGGLGGDATGGDLNFVGGRGGNITALQAGYSNSVRASGAGALNLLGLNVCNGGDLTNTTLTNGSTQATGGASCTASGASSAATSGTGTAAGDVSLLAGLNTVFPAQLGRPLLGLANVGPAGAYSSPGGNFAGSDGSYSSTSASAYYAGLFGGNGGVASWGGSGSNYNSKGSSGGSAASSNSSSSSTGRSGLVILEVLS